MDWLWDAHPVAWEAFYWQRKEWIQFNISRLRKPISQKRKKKAKVGKKKRHNDPEQILKFSPVPWQPVKSAPNKNAFGQIYVSFAKGGIIFEGFQLEVSFVPAPLVLHKRVWVGAPSRACRWVNRVELLCFDWVLVIDRLLIRWIKDSRRPWRDITQTLVIGRRLWIGSQHAELRPSPLDTQQKSLRLCHTKRWLPSI